MKGIDPELEKLREEVLGKARTKMKGLTRIWISLKTNWV